MVDNNQVLNKLSTTWVK